MIAEVNSILHVFIEQFYRSFQFIVQEVAEVPHRILVAGLRLDVLVDDLVICELKAVEEMNSVWQAQLLSHLKLTGKRLGYLINFNVPLIKQGIKRMVL